MSRLLSITLVQPDQILTFFVSLLISIFLGLFIAAVYRYTHRGMNYESSFLSTLVLLAPIVTLVMFFIQGDLVLSLGLVGSLSIIRFRTPIKDTRDMVFLFWTIAIGLGCGTLNWTFAFFATVLLAMLMSAFSLIKYGRQIHAEYILIVAGSSPYNYEELNSFINKTAAHVQLRSHEVDKDQWELTYEFRFNRKLEQTIQGLVAEIRTFQGVNRVSLLTPQLTLPM